MPSKGLPAGFVIRGVVRPPFGRRVTAEAHRVNPRWNAIFSPVRAIGLRWVSSIFPCLRKTFFTIGIIMPPVLVKGVKFSVFLEDWIYFFLGMRLAANQGEICP
jgi:hypothetical protein